MSERLTVHARHAAGRFSEVTVASGRRVTATAGLRGQPVERALAFLPLVFSLCGRAQGIAAARAVEAALGRSLTPAAEASRHLVLAAEALQELWMPVLMDWPRLLGLPPEAPRARALRRALEPLWAPSGLSEVDRVLLEVESFAPGLGTDGLTAVDRFVSRDRGPAGAMVRWLLDSGLAGYGASAVAPLPGEADLTPPLAGDADGAFRAAPLWADGPAETGPLARQWEAPSVAAVRAAFGPGLLARVVARLVDMDAQVRTMRDSADALWHHGLNRCAVAPPAVPAEAAGTGAGRAEAARGTLVHWVDLADGRVRDWRILAPTEWNFHPDGPLVRGLLDAPAWDDPAARVRLMALALDPCVACDVTVSD